MWMLTPRSTGISPTWFGKSPIIPKSGFRSISAKANARLARMINHCSDECNVGGYDLLDAAHSEHTLRDPFVSSVCAAPVD
jgi:hypothetical protein